MGSLGPMYSSPEIVDKLASVPFSLKKVVLVENNGKWTDLKCHATGLGVKGIPGHVVFADPVDIIILTQDKWILFLPLQHQVSSEATQVLTQTLTMKMFSKKIDVTIRILSSVFKKKL